MCTFGVLGLLCETPAASGPNTTKIPREDTQRETKRAKMGAGEGEKSAKCWVPHPSWPHPSWPDFSSVWAPPFGAMTHTRSRNGLAKVGPFRSIRLGRFARVVPLALALLNRTGKPWLLWHRATVLVAHAPQNNWNCVCASSCLCAVEVLLPCVISRVTPWQPFRVSFSHFFGGVLLSVLACAFRVSFPVWPRCLSFLCPSTASVSFVQARTDSDQEEHENDERRKEDEQRKYKVRKTREKPQKDQ